MTGVYGVFVSLDLFVFFLFYELAVLPMYLLIGIWGSTGEVRPRGIFAWAFRETGVGTKEYAAMKLTLYLLFGSAFILVGHLRALRRAGAGSFSFLELEAVTSGDLQRWVFLAFYVGFGILAGIWPLHTWSPDGHASAPTAVSMLHAGVLMKLGAYGVVRVGMGLLPDGAAELAWLVGGIACINVVYGALSAMAQMDLKYVIAYSSVSHMGLVMLGAATLTEAGLNGSVFQMFAHGVMTGPLLRAGRARLREGALARDLQDGRLRPRDARHRDGLHPRRPLVARPARHRGLRRRDPDVPGRLAVGIRWWLFPAVAGTFLTAIYVLRVAKQIFWGPPSPHFHGTSTLPDARGRSGSRWSSWSACSCSSAWSRARARPGGHGDRAAPRPDRDVCRCALALELGARPLLLVVFVAGSGRARRRRARGRRPGHGGRRRRALRSRS